MLRSQVSMQYPYHCKITIVIVDNNTQEDYIEKNRQRYQPLIKCPIIHIQEQRKGISYARNKAIEYAISHHADFLIFLDDDEIPHQQWLIHLYQKQQATSADIISGPVITLFRKQSSAWIKKSHWYQQQNNKQLTKQKADQADSANLMISCAFIKKHKLRFDPDFNVIGGEDSHFYYLVKQHLAKLSWASEAIVYAPLSSKRATFRWHCLRAFRTGSSGIAIIKKIQNKKLLLLTLIKSIAHFALGSGMLVISLLDFRYRLTGIWHLSYSLGVWFGIIGVRYQEYQKINDD